MENSLEPAKWVSSSVVQSDPLTSFSVEQDLRVEEETFYSSSGTDYASLPSYLSNSHSRVSSAFRKSPGWILVLKQIQCQMHFRRSKCSQLKVHLCSFEL